MSEVYLKYETEQRKIILNKVYSIKFDSSGVDMKLSHEEFLGLAKFFEIFDGKYIKHPLQIYSLNGNKSHQLYGCFPSSFTNIVDIDSEVVDVTILFDWDDVRELNSDDVSDVTIYNRDKKLKSIGI